ncbi:MAG: segregation/condensation protein A [Verrucomicrobia bacterium]|nr:segregation/condensation protein A [Verrucomicrobiota bacterium]
MIENKVKLEVFEGPLDLLLYLVKKEEVDIYQVNLTKIAGQFIEYIEVMRQMDLDVAGDFLVMAATLMYIKSRELLPVDQQAAVEEDDLIDDPRWDLIRKLVEYKKFKDAASEFQELETIQANSFPRQPGKFQPPVDQPPLRHEVSLFDLITAVGAVLKRFNKPSETRDVFEDQWTVSEKIEHLMGILNSRSRVRFSELFEGTTSRTEVVVTFLAMLELIRLKQLAVFQQEPFSEIVLSVSDTPAPLAPRYDPLKPDHAGADGPTPESWN